MSYYVDPYNVCLTVASEWLRRDPGVELTLGPAQRDSSERWAAELRERGAHFNWVARNVGPFPIWHVHIGVVIDPGSLYGRAGFHIDPRSPDAQRMAEEYRRHLDTTGLVESFAEAAFEQQWNGWWHDASIEGGVTRLIELALHLTTVLGNAK